MFDFATNGFLDCSAMLGEHDEESGHSNGNEGGNQPNPPDIVSMLIVSPSCCINRVITDSIGQPDSPPGEMARHPHSRLACVVHYSVSGGDN
jgi:hypothetical protein